jgi:hypothetical protein
MATGGQQGKMVVELGQVRGRIGKLETGGAPAPAAATQDPLGSPQSFKVVLKEMQVVPDSVEKGGAQVLDLQPAQGGFVELTFDEPGLYPIVTHKFANVVKGALGLFQAGEVKATGAGH